MISHNSRGTHTNVIAPHHLATIRSDDTIHILDQARIAAHGSQMLSCPVYNRLVALHSSGHRETHQGEAT